MPVEIKSLAGEPYQPSNGTEGDMFMCQYCYNCERDNLNDYGEGGCEIIVMTMGFSPGDDEYPKEWIYDQDGRPTCTAFELKRKE